MRLAEPITLLAQRHDDVLIDPDYGWSRKTVESLATVLAAPHQAGRTQQGASAENLRRNDGTPAT